MKILGLDVGTNSIGWALVDKQTKKILGMGSRIIPMGTDKQDYEKGIGITKNFDRRTKRTIRKMNKRYKLRRNKLLFILNELEILPEQFKFKDGIPEPIKIQNLELLPIERKREYDETGKRKDRIYVDGKRIEQEPDSILNYRLRVKALDNAVDLKELGKILYSFNQLRGYSGGDGNDDNTSKKKQNENEEGEIKKYEIITQKVEILKVEESDKTFKVKGGKNKGQELNKFDVTIRYDYEELEGETELQNLKEKEGKEEELEIRIKRNKQGETTSVLFTLPQKSNWRKLMEKTEEDLKRDKLHVSQLILRDLQQNKWTKIRNRIFLRQRYEAEFDVIWETQCKAHSILNECPKETIEKIANYIFPGKSVSQEKLRQAAITGGLKYIIKDQLIYYQRPLKPQTELIGTCQFEKDEKVLPNSHPLFQEFRCWDQINRMYITSKQEVYNERKKKNVFQYTDRFLTHEEKQEIYNKLQTQKQLGFSEVAKIIKLKNDKTEYLNGLNVKAKLKGCDTQITIKKILSENYNTLYADDKSIIEQLWKAIFDNANNGSEYDPNSLKVSSIKEVLAPLKNESIATVLALKFAQSLKFPRKYARLSEKAINNVLPLMQLNPTNVPEKVKTNFLTIQHLIGTGEILDENLLEEYVISFVKNNANALTTGGLMYAFASSLVYGRHTEETIKPQYKGYHQIKYEKRNLRNPIVEQLTNETMQVVKAVWKEYKLNPEELEIRIELARDLKNSASERDKIYKGQRKNENANREIKERLQAEEIPITDKNILKYKLYVQQKFMSPYTENEIIPLSALFNERLYDIDHIIPKSRYFDDSINNKIICETYINEEKSNRTAWEYISQQNSKFKIRSIEDYISYVNETFYGKKKKNLLLEKIPINPVERQIKDTQYISVAVKNELAKVVGSDNVKTSTGEVTDFLRSRWGLKKLFMELTESRFKLMELWDWNKESDQPNTQWIQKYFDKEKQKHIYEIKNWSKRYDHRHHAIDALVVALTEQSHIQRLNNLNKYLQDELSKRKSEFEIEVKDDETILEAFFNLEEQRRKAIQEQLESSRYFEKPFDDLINQAKKLLEATVTSIKPKDKLSISVDKFDLNTPNKQLKKQIKIRGALHQETNYGKTRDPRTGLLRDTKTVELKDLSAKDVPNIVDKVLREIEIPLHRKKFESMKEAFTGEGLKIFNESRFQSKKPDKLKPPVYKVKIWYSAKEGEESTLQRLYDKNDKLSVVTGDNYLFLVMEKETPKGKARIFDIASLYDSADIAKRVLRDNNENYKQQICEDFRIKHKEKPDTVLFTLQQNDLVYLPENVDDPVPKYNKEKFAEWISDIENKRKFSNRVYRVAKFTGKECYFVPHNYANVISVPKDLTKEQKETLQRKYEDRKVPKKELNLVEYGSYRDCSPYESGEVLVKSLTESDKNKKKERKAPLKIQDHCIKLKVDWLGNISKV